MATKEYLMKYMSTEEVKKIKKKRKKEDKPQGESKKAKVSNVRIFDDDPEWVIRKAQEEEEDVPVVVDEEELKPKPSVVSRLSEKERQGWITVEDEPEIGESAPVVVKTEDFSPPRRPGGVDLSPVRRSRHDSPDPSPPRRRRNDSPDTSPPRRRRNDSPDASPPRRPQPPTSNDASPPRRPISRDESPPRRRRNDCPDASPPRRRRNDSPDASPPRKSRDASPPRRGRRDSEDASPPRRRRNDSPDASPPRQSDEKRKTLSGMTAGLRRADELKDEIEQKRNEERNKLLNMDTSLSGQQSSTVYRDRRGRKLDSLTEFMRQQEGKKPAIEAEKPQWGGGKVQMDEKEKMRLRLEQEKNAPFARYADDEELNEEQRGVMRWGDPMAGKVKPRVRTGNVPQTDRKCPFKAPPNRFGIEPGFHWDGQDRSNGFEGKVAHARYEKEQRALIAYRIGCEDM